MRRCSLTVALLLVFAPGVVYVRREAPRPKAAEVVVVGSRDRELHGKARRRARRAA